MKPRNFEVTEQDGKTFYHLPTDPDNIDFQFIDKYTLKFNFNNQEYTIKRLDSLMFKMKRSRTDNEKRHGIEFSTIVNNNMTIDITDDHFFVYKGKTVTMSIPNILENDYDVVSNGKNPLSLVGIENATGGTATIEGSNVVFNNTSGEIGDTCELKYIAENYNGDRTYGYINIEIQEIPPIITNPDTFDLQQGETLLVSKSSLAENDVDGLDLPLTVTAVQNPVNGEVTLDGDNISFTSTGISGFPAEFDYTVENSDGKTETGKVYVNVTPLPPIEALIYDTDSEVQNAITNGYTPPTVQDIFDNWARIDGEDYYSDKTTAAGGADDWQLLSNPERISMPTNISPGNGFVSPDSFDNYTFEVTLTSPSSDDDTIGLIAAFTRDGSTNKTLYLSRTKGGNVPRNGFGFVYSENGGITWAINNISVGGASGGWSGQKSRVKIERRGDILTAYATEWNDTSNYQVYSKIELDLNSDSRLEVFKGKKPYGYYTLSQPDSTYLDAVFKGGMDASKMYDVSNNVMWEYSNEAWSNSGITIQEDLGYIRDATNPETGTTYTIKGDEIVKKS